MQEPIFNHEQKKTFPLRLAIIFVFFSVAIILTGIFYYNSQKKDIFKQEEDNLAAIASLKTSQIKSWRTERLGDASVIRLDKPLIRSISDFLYSKNSEAKIEITEWMESLINHYDYKNVLITDTLLKVRLSIVPSDTILGDSIRKELKAGLKSHSQLFSDFHESKEVGYIHLDLLIPLFDSFRKNQEAIGVVILRIDPEKILYPLIQSWPTKSKSSETLLLRKEGDSVLYLNNLRHAENTALKLKMPLTNKDLLATKAVNGSEGITEGSDYRNIPVIGSISRISETPWYMVAKVDKQEILLPLKRLFLMITIVVILLILINASIFGFWIWQQVSKAEEKLLESEELYRELFENMLNGFAYCRMIYKDGHPYDFMYMKVNEAFRSLTGLYDVEGKKVSEAIPGIHEADPELLLRYGRVASTGNAEMFETYVESLKMWFSISVYSPQKGYFVAVFDVITVRKLAEEKLQESRATLRNIIDNSNSLIYMVDLEGRFIMVNKHLQNLLSLSGEALIGQTREAFLPIDIASLHRNNDLEVIASRKTRIFEEENNESDGKHIYLTTKFPLFNNHNEIYAVGGLSTDITERKRIEKTLKESEDKFKYVFDHSVAGKSVTFPSGEIHVNKAFCDMTGYTPEELSNTKWQDITYPDDIKLTEKELQALISGKKKSTRFIKRYIHKNGNIVWADVGTALRHDDNGSPLYFMTTAIDITERKHAEESLRLKNFVFDDSIAANSISDISGILTEVNAAFLRIWGYQTRSEVIGKTIASFIKSDADANKILTALTKDGEWEGDYSALRKDGSTFIAHGLATVVKDEKGKAIGYQSAVIDVTDSRRAEELVRRINEELELKVMQRTELLEAANKELEAFSYSVSHDLRAPLRSVHGYTKILAEEYESRLDEEGIRICSIISSSATQMGELIDDLLSFSRIGRSSMNPSRLDMKSIVHSVFEEISNPDEKARTTLKIGKLHKAYGDANLLKLVWTNLISNAIKYSSKESISEISVNSHLAYDRITYSVKDNGVGFDMKYRHKLFGVFQRLHSEAEFEGNGVGLAIVQRIILKHGGNVWAESDAGMGATFYFSLPVQAK